jgi:hypothetical protein
LSFVDKQVQQMSVKKLSHRSKMDAARKLRKKRKVKIDEWYAPPTKPIRKESIRAVLAIIVVSWWLIAANIFCASGRSGAKDFTLFVGPTASLIVAYYFQHDRSKTKSRANRRR